MNEVKKSMAASIVARVRLLQRNRGPGRQSFEHIVFDDEDGGIAIGDIGHEQTTCFFDPVLSARPRGSLGSFQYANVDEAPNRLPR